MTKIHLTWLLAGSVLTVHETQINNELSELSFYINNEAARDSESGKVIKVRVPREKQDVPCPTNGG